MSNPKYYAEDTVSDREEKNSSSDKIDLASLFPVKGDDRRPPDWLGRALLYVVMMAFIAIFLWFAWEKISFVVFDVIVSMFIALAMEPLVVRLIKHGWRRGVASGVTLFGLIVSVGLMLGLFGNMFVQQAISMITGLPKLYEQFSKLVQHTAHVKLPNIEQLVIEILKNIQTSWVVDFGGFALNTTWGLFSGLLDLLTILMVTYYISAAGPRMRRSFCRWLNPKSQRRFVFIWSVVQEQISSFLFSRIILAVINAVGTAIFLICMHVPYWLPLSLFCGIVSQFVPTVGTYLGGALPIIFAWSSNGFGTALATLAFVTIYQQIENMVISPKISEKTMDLNPAIAFLSVLILGAVFGALGAFLALPVTASLQAIFKVYTKSYDLIDSPLMEDPKPDHKSIMVAGAEAIDNSIVRPVRDSVVRVLKGSSSRVTMNDEVLYWYKQAYEFNKNDSLDSDSLKDNSLKVNSYEVNSYEDSKDNSRVVCNSRVVNNSRENPTDNKENPTNRSSESSENNKSSENSKTTENSVNSVNSVNNSNIEELSTMVISREMLNAVNKEVKLNKKNLNSSNINREYKNSNKTSSRASVRNVDRISSDETKEDFTKKTSEKAIKRTKRKSNTRNNPRSGWKK
ncbi:AI-2E family transporter [Gardnerella vaginalis]|uniref:AI-2E family transporter n=1 Tax=Gardnerella vaginalis TaxID=2702 RepID=A0A2K1SU72_GARVA|nr:AI-2E family transporter [Gardnerella vaginalis]